MPITTQDCKDFIKKLAPNINASSDTWKRVKKYKEGDLILRKFENENGRTLIIAEEQNSLFLYSLEATLQTRYQNKTQQFIESGKKNIGHSVSDKEVLQFMVECVKADNNIIIEYIDDEADEEELSSYSAKKDAVLYKSWTIWEIWSDFKSKESKNYYQHPLEDFFEDGWAELELYYPDKNGKKVEVKKEDIKQVFWVGMPKYDTMYRIYIFETKDNHLLLGINDPD